MSSPEHKDNKDKKREEEKKIIEQLKKLPLLNIEYDLYYHGIKPLKKIDLTRYKLLSVVFVVLGLFVVYYLAFLSPAIYANIQDVYGNFMYNYAVVVIKGNVTETPSVRIDNTGRMSVYFTVSDGTGSISARIYDPLARQALAEGKVPGVGDYVEAEMQIRVLESYTYAIVQSLDTMKIVHPYLSHPPKKVSSLTISMAEHHDYVEINGSITNVRKTSSGLYLIYVNTGTDTIVTVLPNYLQYVNGTLDPQTHILHPNPKYNQILKQLVIGVNVDIKGIVHLYRTMPELIINRLDDINVQSSVATNTSIDQIVFQNNEYVGKFVVIRNAWLGPISYDRTSGNYFVDVYDDTYHTKAIFLSRSFRDNIKPFTVGTGSRLTIIGVVCNDTSMAVVDYNITSTRPAPLMLPSQLTADLEGYMVAVRGYVSLEGAGISSTSYGCPVCDYYHGVASVGSVYRFTLIDPKYHDHKLAIFMPSSAYNYMDPSLRELIRTNGTYVIVAGYLTIYNGELELVAYSPDSVMPGNETPPGEGLTPPPLPRYKPVHEITPVSAVQEKRGEIVALDVILDSISMEGNQYVLTVHDNTGTINVYATQSLLRNLDPFHNATGSEIVVVGIVTGRKTLYIQASEIVPCSGVPAQLYPISSINQDLNGKIIAVKGEVVSVESNIVKITDGSNILFVRLDPSVQLTPQTQDLLQPGNNVTIAGILQFGVPSSTIIVYSANGIQPGDYEWRG